MTFHRMGLAFCTALLLLGVAVPVWAAPGLIRYHGSIEKDGVEFSATGSGIRMTLALYPDSGQGTQAVYSQTLEGVQVYAGRFSVQLGPDGVDASQQAVTLKQVMYDNPDLYVGVTLHIGSPETDVALTGRTRLTPAPAAINAQQADDFRIKNSLTVGSVSHASVPAGAVMFFNLASCPQGWSEMTALRGRYVVGVPAGGTLAASVGTVLSNQQNRAAGQHTHAYDDKFLRGSGGVYWHNGSGTYGNSQHTTAIGSIPAYPRTTGTGDGLTAGTNAPYVQLLTCQKD